MPKSVKNPAPENPHTKIEIIHPKSVKLRVLNKLLLGILVIKKAIPNYCELGKYNIVELVNPCLIHRLSRETIKKTKVKLDNYIQHVFIKVISNDIRISSITLPPMNKHQRN